MAYQALDFSDVQIDIRAFSTDFDGISDLSKAIQIIMNNFESFFKNELTNMLAWRLAKSVEKSMNTMLFNGGEILSLPES